MTADESADDALFSDPLPEGFSRRVVRAEPGLELDLDAWHMPGCIVVVEEGEVELECRSGTRRRFARGSMIPIGQLLIAHVRSIGPDPLVLVAVSRASLRGTDEFLSDPGSYVDC
jgi:hypothetical protein